ncbi:DUF802 domain-containing protein [Burkholderia plantarii]|uniref:DUF802 domain-containing protein n=1 Tax=Burkholderia plantarii TaxID=41899 RepID=UPI0006D8B813|nr:DUF802 domain-containing protein [Burkholderia plantarii]ALK34023.1 methyl-accepting chemotaxis protein [Burkholderia plantarii]GLZ22164.1 hypothetical protein Bpla01_56930 [Burkholderia plantarii]
MSRLRIDLVVFLAGLAVVCWIGAGYLATNPLALAVTALIAACYAGGAFELHRYRQATANLARALALPAAPASSGAWLDALHPSLRGAVRARLDGERAALPGPALTPYLVGLLVLLGMLGTLLGMVATLRGTSAALDGATGLDAIRVALYAPIRGLGFAFGTSIAGVASSAMLGLLSALCRRERLEVAQRLDAQLATTLRPFTQAQQREAGFLMMQRQAEALPTLVARLETLIAGIERQSTTLGEHQMAGQQAFLASAEASYTRLAATLGDALTASAEHSARAAGAAIAPVVEAAMAGLARESAALHGSLTQAVERQLDGLTTGFESNATRVAGIWTEALDAQRRWGDTLAHDLRGALDGFNSSFEARSTALLREVGTQQATAADGVSQAWQAALARQEQTGEKLAGEQRQALAAAADTFGRQAAGLLRELGTAQADWQARLAERDDTRLKAWTAELAALGAALRGEWHTLNAQAAQQQQAVCATLERTAGSLVAQAETQTSRTLAEIARAATTTSAAWQTASAQAAERQQALGEALERTTHGIAAQAEAQAARTIAEIKRAADTASAAWLAASTQAAERQEAVCDALAKTAGEIAAQTEAQASGTIAEIARAAEANASAWKAASTEAAERQQTICDALAKTATEIATQTEAHASGTIAEIARAAEANASAWKAASTEAAERQQTICDALAKTAAEIAAQTEAHASGTIAEIARAAEANASAWKAASTEAAERQQTICDALAKTATEIAAHTETHANGTIAEIARLADAAADAPRAAAEIVGELRRKLSESMVQDTAMLEERARLLSTVATLLDAVSHASTEQRDAIDALVQTSAGLMERVGTRFDEQVAAGAQALDGVAAQVTGSAVEMASLADAFGQAVQQFGATNDQLMTQLQRIEAALDQSLARSDEQLAYYVAQAKDVIDLSLLSQKQIVDNLQRIGGTNAA